MNNQAHFNSESDDWRVQLAAFIKEWEEQTNDTAALDHILALIFSSTPISSPLTSEDSIMLSLVISDALNGVNIAEKYPTFFLRMLENKALLVDFLDTLNLLRQTRSESLPVLPAEPSRDLSFLRRRPQPEIKERHTSKEGWRVVLQQAIQQLENIFFTPPSLQPATRKGIALPLDEEQWFTLFRQEVSIDHEQWTVLLEGKAADDLEVSLNLDISVLPMADDATIPSLIATIQWGEYQDRTMIGPRGRATFSPVPLEVVLDESSDSIKAPLQVTVETFNESLASL